MKKLFVGLLFLASTGSAFGAQAAGLSGGDLTERMMFLAMQLGIIMFATRIGKWGFETIKLPGVLGELISGMLIGPFALGGIGIPGLPHGVFPIADAIYPISPELYAFGAVAAIVHVAGMSPVAIAGFAYIAGGVAWLLTAWMRAHQLSLQQA